MSDTIEDVPVRIRELLAKLKLPTLAEQLVRRLVDAGHEYILPLLL